MSTKNMSLFWSSLHIWNSRIEIICESFVPPSATVLAMATAMASAQATVTTRGKETDIAMPIWTTRTTNTNTPVFAGIGNFMNPTREWHYQSRVMLQGIFGGSLTKRLLKKPKY